MANVKHAVVRTDSMYGTDSRPDPICFKYMGSDGSAETEIDNGHVVTVDKIVDKEREIWSAKDVETNSPVDNIILVASPELEYDEHLKALDQFYNKAKSICRGYRLHNGNIFSVTPDALTGEEASVGKKIELAKGNSFNVVTEATEGSTQVGKVIAIEQVGLYKYVVISVELSGKATASAPVEETPPAKVYEQSKTLDDLGGKKVSELIDGDVSISKDGAVTGTLKYVPYWKEFGSAENDQSGYYLPVQLDSKYEGQNITCVGTQTKTAQDLEWVLHVKDKNSTFKFSADPAPIRGRPKKIAASAPFLTLTFSGATFSLPTGKAGIDATKKDYGGFGTTADYYEGDLTYAWQGTKCAVTGTIKYLKKDEVPAATKLSGDGNYFAFKLIDSYKQKPITVTVGSNEPKTAADTDWVISVKDKANHVVVKDGSTEIADFDLSGCEVKTAEG